MHTHSHPKDRSRPQKQPYPPGDSAATGVEGPSAGDNDFCAYVCLNGTVLGRLGDLKGGFFLFLMERKSGCEVAEL